MELNERRATNLTGDDLAEALVVRANKEYMQPEEMFFRRGDNLKDMRKLLQDRLAYLNGETTPVDTNIRNFDINTEFRNQFNDLLEIYSALMEDNKTKDDFESYSTYLNSHTYKAISQKINACFRKFVAYCNTEDEVDSLSSELEKCYEKYGIPVIGRFFIHEPVDEALRRIQSKNA